MAAARKGTVSRTEPAGPEAGEELGLFAVAIAALVHCSRPGYGYPGHPLHTQWPHPFPGGLKVPQNPAAFPTIWLRPCSMAVIDATSHMRCRTPPAV